MPSTTRQHLVNRLSGRCGMTPLEAGAAIDIILGELKHAMLEGRRIEIRGFGAFSPHQRAARNGRNPRSSAKITIPAKQVPVFKPSPELTALINRTQDSPHPPASGNKPSRATRDGDSSGSATRPT